MLKEKQGLQTNALLPYASTKEKRLVAIIGNMLKEKKMRIKLDKGAHVPVRMHPKAEVHRNEEK